MKKRQCEEMENLTHKRKKEIWTDISTNILAQERSLNILSPRLLF